MASILITGVTGFIGRALKQKIESMGFDVVGLSSQDGDIAQPGVLENISSKDIAHAFHLAGRTYVPDSWQHPDKFYRTNTMGTLTVLDYCRRADIPLTYVSAYIFGRPVRMPVAEEHPVQSSNPYAHSKFMGEELCRYYTQAFDLPVSIIRPFNVYGPEQDQRFLIPSIIKQVLFGDEIRVLDLNPKRDFVFIDDLVDALIRTLRCRSGLHVYNIGSGISYSVAEVVKIVQKCCRSDKAVVSANQQRNSEIPDVVCDSNRAKTELEWSAKVGLDEGVNRIVASCLVEAGEKSLFFSGDEA